MNGEEMKAWNLYKIMTNYTCHWTEFFKHNKRGSAMGDAVYSISVLGTGGVGKSALICGLSETYLLRSGTYY